MINEQEEPIKTPQQIKESLEIQKLQKENEKLANEIELQKRPLRNPANWAPFATLIGTSFALIWAVSSGWFTNQKEKLEIAVHHLEEARNLALQSKNEAEKARYVVDSALMKSRLAMKEVDSALKSSVKLSDEIKDSLTYYRNEIKKSQDRLNNIRSKSSFQYHD